MATPTFSRPKEAPVPKGESDNVNVSSDVILQLFLRKIIRIAIPISKLPVLTVSRGKSPNAGTCTENYSVNVYSDVKPRYNYIS